MSSHVVPMWKRNWAGKLDIAHVDGDDVAQRKVEGWFDSPDKVPSALPGTVELDPQPEPLKVPPHQGPYGSVHGEGAREAERSVRARGRPRKSTGQFKAEA